MFSERRLFDVLFLKTLKIVQESKNTEMIIQRVLKAWMTGERSGFVPVIIFY